MSKFVPWAGLFSDYLDVAGPDGVDRPGECHQPPTSAAKRNFPSLPESTSSGLSVGPFTRNLQSQPPAGGGGPSQGQDPTRTKATDVRQMMPLAGGLGPLGAISHAEATMPNTWPKSVCAYPESPCQQALDSQTGLNASIWQ